MPLNEPSPIHLSSKEKKEKRKQAKEFLWVLIILMTSYVRLKPVPDVSIQNQSC